MRPLIACLAFFAVNAGCASSERRSVPNEADANMPGTTTSSGAAITDALYAEYGGPREPNNPPPPTGAGTSYSEAWAHQRDRMQVEQMEQFGNGARLEAEISRGGVDDGAVVSEERASDARALFAARCEVVGHGEEPEWGGDERAKEFFDRPEVRARCADVVRLKRHATDGR